MTRRQLRTNIRTYQCGDKSKTPLLVVPEGDRHIQVKPYCLNWDCTNIDCRMVKADNYLDYELIRYLRWYGSIPDSKWNAVSLVRKRHQALTFTILRHDGDRIVASDMNLSPRSHLMLELPNIDIIRRLKHELVYGLVRRVYPSPKRQSRGYKLIGVGDPVEQFIVQEKANFRLEVGEIGDGIYVNRNKEHWTTEESVRLIGGQLNTVSLRGDYESIQERPRQDDKDTTPSQTRRYR